MYQELIEFCSIKNIILVVVTKTRSVSAIMNFYNKGHRTFGENRVQELREKHETLAKDIEWHMIGHLQSNKVKYIASFVHMIHSGTNYSLLKEINKRAKLHDRIIDVLLQIKIGQEKTKTGWDKDKLFTHFVSNDIQSLDNIRIRGVMGMATFTPDQKIVSAEFSNLKVIFDQLKSAYFSNQPTFDTISMGMSGDYQIAAKEGSTMIRIGSLLFQ